MAALCGRIVRIVLRPALVTRGHSVKLMKHRCTTDLQKYFFSERVIDRWNLLTEDCVSSSRVSVGIFATAGVFVTINCDLYVDVNIL